MPNTRVSGKNDVRASAGTPTSTPSDGVAVPAIDTSDLSKDNQIIVDRIISGVVSYFQKILDERDDEIKEAKSSIKSLEQRVSKLENHIDATDSYERRDTLIISGQVPTVSENENCTTIVRNLLKDVHLNIKTEDVSTAHRIGKRPLPGRPDRRNIIFKLCRRDTKRDILDACRQQRPPFYINESLTPTRSAIMFVLRKVKKNHPNVISNARSHDGNVHVFLPKSDVSLSQSNSRPKFNKIMINTKSALEDFLLSNLSCNSDKFIDRWPDIN